MAKYKCVRCGQEIEQFYSGVVRCPNCSYRVVEKMRSEVVKEIPAI